MNNIAIVTNATFLSEGAKYQSERIARVLKEKYNIETKLYSFNRPWTVDDIKDFPQKCIFFNKDISFARLLEQNGVRLYNSANSIEICDDKRLTYITLSRYNDIDMPNTFCSPKRYFGYPSCDELDFVEKKLGYPVVIKEAKGSLGGEVYLAKNRDELNAITKKIGAKDKLYQQYVADSEGRSIRVFVVGDKVVGAIRLTNDMDFRSNAERGGIAKSIEISADFEAKALEISKVLGLDFCGVDFFDLDYPKLIEVNSNAYFKAIEGSGVDVTDCIVDYIVGDIK